MTDNHTTCTTDQVMGEAVKQPQRQPLRNLGRRLMWFRARSQNNMNPIEDSRRESRKGEIKEEDKENMPPNQFVHRPEASSSESRRRLNRAAFRFHASLRGSVVQDFFHEADILRVHYPRCPMVLESGDDMRSSVISVFLCSSE